MPISPFTSLQIAGIAVLVYALLNTIFNLTLIARDIVQHGYKKRLTQFVSVLSAFLSVITTLVACWYTGDATIGVITNDGLNTLRILYGISTTTLLIAIVTLSGQSIYKFDTILPHVETPVRKWGFRILYGLHSCIFLVCLVYNIVSVNTLFFVTDEFKAGTTALGFNIAWCSVLEGFVSAIFLRALLVHKTKIVSGNYQSNSKTL